MAKRDDFPLKVKQALAQRVGFRCSYPGCGLATTGPSSESPEATVNVGVAAHIAAAAPNGPRYDPRMTAETRRSISNGVWLCQHHSRLIDVDSPRFSVRLLHGWRVRAELKARLSIDAGKAYLANRLQTEHSSAAMRLLVRHDVDVEISTDVDLRAVVQDFTEDTGVAAWGEDAYELVQTTLYELGANALEHGDSSNVHLSTSANAVLLSHDGPEFGLTDLLRTDGRGGKASVNAIRELLGSKLIVTYRRQNSMNEWSVADILAGTETHNPCAVRFRKHETALSDGTLERLAGCDEIHVFPPHFWSFSDAYYLAAGMMGSLQGRRLVLHGIKAGSPLAQFMQSRLPEVAFIS